jgi:hypothetical protein
VDGLVTAQRVTVYVLIDMDPDVGRCVLGVYSSPPSGYLMSLA